MPIYTGDNGVARKAKGIYAGVNGAARKITKAYAGVNGVARLIYNANLGNEWVKNPPPQGVTVWSTPRVAVNNNGQYIIIGQRGTGGLPQLGIYRKYEGGYTLASSDLLPPSPGEGAISTVTATANASPMFASRRNQVFAITGSGTSWSISSPFVPPELPLGNNAILCAAPTSDIVFIGASAATAAIPLNRYRYNGTAFVRDDVSFPNATGRYTALKSSGAGDYLIAEKSASPYLEVWHGSAANNNPYKEVPIDISDMQNQIRASYSEMSNTLALSSTNKIKIFRLVNETATPLQTITMHNNGASSGCALSDSGNTLVVGGTVAPYVTILERQGATDAFQVIQGQPTEQPATSLAQELCISGNGNNFYSSENNGGTISYSRI